MDHCVCMNIYLVVFLTLIAALIASFSQFLFKTGLRGRLDSIKDIIKTVRHRRIAAGLFGYAVSFLIYIFVLRTSQLSIVFPIFASSFIFVTFISAVQLKETLSLHRIVGILLVFSGIVIVTLTA